MTNALVTIDLLIFFFLFTKIFADKKRHRATILTYFCSFTCGDRRRRQNLDRKTAWKKKSNKNRPLFIWKSSLNRHFVSSIFRFFYRQYGWWFSVYLYLCMELFVSFSCSCTIPIIGRISGLANALNVGNGEWNDRNTKNRFEREGEYKITYNNNKEKRNQ